MKAMHGGLLAIAGEDVDDLFQEGGDCSEAVCVSAQEMVGAPRQRLHNKAVNVG